MLQQTLLALDYIHTDNPQIIHWNIKPPNTLFQGDNFFLIDFGITKSIDTSKTFVGTQSYLAPKLWLERWPDTKGWYIYAWSNFCWVLGGIPTQSRKAATAAVAPVSPNTCNRTWNCTNARRYRWSASNSAWAPQRLLPELASSRSKPTKQYYPVEFCFVVNSQHSKRCRSLPGAYSNGMDT